MKSRVGTSLTVTALFAIVLATLLPGTWPQRDFDPWCISCGALGGVDVVANFLLFVPLGVGLGLRGIRPIVAVPAMVLLTFTIEALQATVIPGRDPALGDFVMNSAGGVFGFIAGRRLDTLVRPRAVEARFLFAAWATLWIAVQAIAAFAIVPVATEWAYYGQIGRALGEMYVAFPGRIVGPQIGGLPIVNWEIRDPRVRQALMTDSPALSALVIPARCAVGDRSEGIIRVADRRYDEVVVLAREGSALVYGLRTGADVLRLSPVRYRLRDAFPSRRCAATSDSVQVSARRWQGVAELEVSSAAHTARAVLRLRAWDSWKLFSPWRRYVDGTMRSAVQGILWFVALTLPLGYYARGLGSGRWATGAAMALVLAGGLLAAPRLLTAPAFGIAEVVVALVATGAGWLLHRGLEGRRRRQRVA